MAMAKLFKVLVVGGTALAALGPGCGESAHKGEKVSPGTGEDAELRVPDAATGTPDSGIVLEADAGEDADGGVSSWLHWF